MRVNSISLSYYKTANTVNDSGTKVEGEQSDTVYHDTSQLSRWGMRILSGMSVDYFNPALAGVVFQVELRFGFDVSNVLFNNEAFKNIMVANGVSQDLRRTYIELSGGMYIGAAYRLPLGGISSSSYAEPVSKERPKGIDG